ncbi:MAG: carboxypeptidase-like regulatory domain-containing protein [Thermodesulfobacteriota bacterium]|nr:carboxypeptidase-like regulatory domain-containing protein [Thermodesulfobacteriota bacterium]
MGVINEQHTACDKTPAATLLLPIDITDIDTPDDIKDTYEWNTPFTIGTTHECVKAEAKLLCTDVDFAWAVIANDFEGQRNTDEMTIVPLPPPPLPFPNLQGFKEHIYGIQNRFDFPRRFILVFPEGYQGYKDAIELNWFEIVTKDRSEQIPLVVVDQPVMHIPFMLKAGEKKDILLHVKMKAGFTVTIKKGNSTLKGAVLDRKNNPVRGAKIYIRTVNELQGGAVLTDKSGNYAFTDINPDIYYIHAEAENWRSREQMVLLLNGKEEDLDLYLTEEVTPAGKHLKVILDKIRIMNDRDPCIKGKGELTFFSIAIPDNDDSRKQVTLLPGKGVYHISDKPGENEIRLGGTLFDGIVKNRSLSHYFR